MQSKPNNSLLDDFAFGERIINYIRWPLLVIFLLFNNLGFTEDRSLVWPINFAILGGLFLTGIIQYRLQQGYSFGKRLTFALAVVQDALLTAGVALTGFYNSHFFIFYYPSLLGFSLAFSLRTSLVYASVVGLVYSLLSWFLPLPGVSGDPTAIKILVERWLVLYTIVIIGWYLVRQERIRRMAAISTEQQTAQENEQLYRRLNEQLENWQLIGQANNRTAEQLATLAQDLISLVDQMSTGSQGIATATEEITSRAITFVDQVAAIGQVTDKVVTAAHELAASAGPTGITLEQAQRAVAQATEAVESLNQRAQAISDLATTVRRVADQTNLLAFNANVEAIQAGDRGQRFGVVANEVRLVAERAIQLGREIGDLSAEVQVGTRRVLNAMSQIAAMVEQTAGLVQVTSQASQSQQTSAEVVADSVSTLKTVSRQNARDIRAVTDTVHQQRTSLQRILELGQELASSASKLSSLTETLGG